MTSSADEEKAKRKAAKKEKKRLKKEKKRQKLEENGDDGAVEEEDDTAAKEVDLPKLEDDEIDDIDNNKAVDTHENENGDETTDGAEGTKRKRKRKRKRKAGGATEEDEEATATPTTSTTATADLSTHTVFVEGIPFDASVDDVWAFFLQSSILESDILELRLPTWQDTGRLRGFGHVRLAHQEAYDQALALHRQYMGPRYLSIQPAKDSGTAAAANHSPTLSLPAPDGCLTLFCNNLPYSASEADIASAFSKCCTKSTVTEGHIRIARNSVTRQSKGFGYIDFDTVPELEAVVQAQQERPIVVSGRPMRLDYDTGRIKGSYRADSGRLWTKEQTEKKKQQQQQPHSRGRR